MCNDDRNINAVSTGTGKHVLYTKSFHKRTVGQGHTDTYGQVLPVHNRFMALCSDFRTQDTNSSRDKVVHSHQSTQTPKLACQSNADTANVTKASTSRYFQHSSCYSSHNITNESREQLGSKFGCLPLSPILLYNGDPKHRSEVLDVLQAHRLIRESGVPNFWGLRIPVKTQLDIAAWRFYLRDYFDQQLLDLSEFGFPLDFDRACSLSSLDDNHTSAVKYPSHVEEYLLEELNHNAILGPLDSPPFPIHVSPFMTREKSG